MSLPKTNEEVPDIANLSLHSKTAPTPLESNLELSEDDSSSSSSASSISSQQAKYSHGLPNISADLQARVLAFQEKRQAANAAHKREEVNSQETNRPEIRKKPASLPSSLPQQPGQVKQHSSPSSLSGQLLLQQQQLQKQQQQQQRRPQPRLQQTQSQPQQPLAFPNSPDKSSPKKIAPPMRLPPSLPQVTSISSPALTKASPQAALRLPRSRPSLSQRRGMKLNVNDINNNDDDENTTQAQRNNGGPTSKMITSSSSNSASQESLDTKKKPVAEFIGKRGQLSNPQQLPKLQGLFANYSKYVDIKSGSLNFSGKASLHSKGVDFSGGSSFRISIDELEFIEELGRGNYGTVSKVLHKPTNIIMAMKEVRLELDDSKFRQIIMELEILHNCDSEYIVDFYGAFFVEGAVYMCIEYMNLGSLDKIYKGGIPELQLAYIAKCVIIGLKQLKDEQNIIHRDVKPTNILVNDQGKIKLCDFGVSGNLVLSMARTNIGCQSYMAPERIKSANPDDVSYSVQSDIWSLGLTLLEVADGEYPLISENIFSQLKQIVEDDPPVLSDKFSIEAKNFVHCCLAKDPQLRPTYLELLQHPWLLKYKDDLKSEHDLKEFLCNIKKD